MRIAILTGGGDCPGLNAVIRAVVKTAHNEHGWDVIGVKNGFEGFLARGDSGFVTVTREMVAGLLPRGGTILGASNRCDLFAVRRGSGPPKDESARVGRALRRLGARALLLVGGEGTLKGGLALARLGVPIVGVPKTIDNDVSGTDRTFGFDTAVHVVAEALDRLHTTAESHHRVMCVEVMGRHAGWIGLHGGISGGADVILLPEIPYDPVRVGRKLASRARHGRTFSIVVVAEGARRDGGKQVWARGHGTDPVLDRLGGAGMVVAEEIREHTGLETRTTVLGHVQRGGTPTAFDRELATRMGAYAVVLVEQRRFGRVVALQGTALGSVPLAAAVRRLKTVDPAGEEVRTARRIGVSFAAADGSDDRFDRARARHGAP
jgi:ATP-dependent phosphofructokinase / diphosphate-dependent phosphofructokinase